MDNTTETRGDGLEATFRRDALAATTCQVIMVGSLELLLVTVGDKYYAMDNQCTHADSWLDMGTVEPATREIICPLHGGAFDLESGDPTRSPCTVPVRTYGVTVTEESITIDLGDRHA